MFILVDKPKGLTSHDVIDEVRKITVERRVGHAGTLDPNATGLLIVGVGKKATKKLGNIAKETRKTYQAEIFLGEERDTDDSEGVVISKAKGILSPTETEVRLMLVTFLGKQRQTPPVYSAVKIKGKKAYELARKGKKVSLKSRKVVIYSVKLLSYKYPTLVIKVSVSSGTYIRALARDIGKRLGCGAYLKNLRRLAIGKYKVEDAVALKTLTSSNWKKFAVAVKDMK